MESLVVLAILLLIVFVPVFYVIGQYNGFVALRNHISEAWSNIDTELKRRHDLIPNLVNVVKGYAAHEQAVLERVTQLRAQCMGNQGGATSQIADENQLAGALQRLLALVENYPQLKADAGFRELQSELVNTEDRIQAARRFYNGNVRDYRNKYEGFPTNLIASAFHFEQKFFLEIEPAVRVNPVVDLRA